MARKNQIDIGVNLTPDKVSLKDAEAVVRGLGEKFEQMLSLRTVVDMTPLRNAEKTAGAIGRRMLNTEKMIADLRKKSSEASQKEAKQAEKYSKTRLKEEKVNEAYSNKYDAIKEKYGESPSDADKPRMEQELSNIKQQHDEKMSSINTENDRIRQGIESAQKERLKYEDLIKKKQEDLQKLKPAAYKAAKDVAEKKSQSGMSAIDVVAANDLIKTRQERMAKKIKGMGITKTESEAMELAKRKIKMIKQETSFGKKLEIVNKKAWKGRRQDYLEQNKEITEKYQQARKSGKIGFLGALLGEGREKKQLRKETGAVSVGGAVEKVTGGIGGAVMGGIGRLAGPLLALTTLTGMIKMFLDVDEQIKNANKDMYRFAATGAGAWKTIEKGGSTSIDQLTNWTMKFNEIFDETGIKFEDAIRYVGALTSAGIPLEKVLEDNKRLFKDVNMMAINSGVSFEEMSGITGKWVTEFRKGTKDVTKTFVQLRSDAAESGMTTQKFYENVMNAAQGTAIYRNNIEGVSTAFSGLVKNLRMPQEAAAEITKSLISLPEDMSASQAALLNQLAGGNHALAQGVRKEFDALIDSASGLSKEQKNAIKSRKELSDIDLISRDQLELVRKANPEMAKQIDALSKSLSVKYTEPLSEAKAMLKTMDSSKFMETLVGAIPKMMPEIFKNIDLGDPDAMAKVFQKSQVTIETVTKSLNMSGKQIDLIKQEYQKFADNVGKYSSAMRSSFKTDKDAVDATNEILGELKSGGKGRAEAEKKIAAIIAKSPDKTSKALQSTFGIKFTNDAKQNAKMVADAMLKQQTGFGDIGKKLQQTDIKERKKAADAQAQIIEQGTKPIKDEIQETIGQWLREIYTGIMKVYHAVMGKDEEALKAYDTMNEAIHKLDNNLIKKKQEISDVNVKLRDPKLKDADKKVLEERRKQLANEIRDIGNQRLEYNKSLVRLEEYKDAGWLRTKGMDFMGDTKSAVQKAKDIKAAEIANKGGKREDTNKLAESMELLRKSFSAYVGKTIAQSTETMIPALQKSKKDKWLEFKSNYQKTNSNIDPNIIKAFSEVEKQYGFVKGGFTGTGPDNQIAGVVHKNELVVDANTVRKAGLPNLISQIGASAGNINSAISRSGMAASSQTNKMSTLTPMMMLQEVNKSIAGLSTGTVNNNQQVTINVNQRDTEAIEQIVRKVIYHSKEGR